MSPQPNNRYHREETANTIKFFDKIFTVFFDLANPASKEANPKFIKNTSIPARSTHNVSKAILTSMIHSSLKIKMGAIHIMCTAPLL